MSSSSGPFAGIGMAPLLLVGLLGALVFFSLDAALVDQGASAFGVRLRTKEAEGDVPFNRWLSEANRRGRQGLGNPGGGDAPIYDTVHTFFSPIDPHTRLPTDRLNATDQAMLDSWKAAWESQGWRTRILSIDNARAHPQFEAYNRLLDRVPLGANAAYNRYCYLRWLAIAAVGGGYMSDYDTIPLRPPSSAGFPDRLTVYGGAVPSLVGGSEEEWERMIQQLFTTAMKQARKVKKNLWSDMMILQELNQNDEYFVLRHETLTSKDAMARLAFTPEDCNFFRSDGNKRDGGFRLVHFSHSGLRTEQYPHRPEIMRDWIQEWSAKCNGVELRLDIPSIEVALREKQQGQPAHLQPHLQGARESIQRPREGFSWDRLREVMTSGTS